QDKAKTIRHVIGHLFKPMLYTSLTTIAGFASLATTPIPPVRIFGLHVAFGVALAWVLTMTFVPAYIMLFVSEKSLKQSTPKKRKEKRTGLDGALEKLGTFSYRHWKLILVITSVVVAVSAYGVSRIQVNDNPVKWFTKSHRIRIADKVLNSHFGGTYTAYLTLTPETVSGCTCTEALDKMSAAARERFADKLPKQTEKLIALLDTQKEKYRNVATCDPDKCFVHLINEAKKLDEQTTAPWRTLSDSINYLDDAALASPAAMQAALTNAPAGFFQTLEKYSGEELREKVLEKTDQYTALSFVNFLYEQKAEITAPPFKRPEMLRWIATLQNRLIDFPKVGKTSSAVDALKKASYELQYIDPAQAPEEQRAAVIERNQKNYSVPDSAAACGQVFLQLEGMKKKDALFHLVTRDYREANIWVQLRSGDNKDMEAVVADVNQFVKNNPPPEPLKLEWAGLTYLNVVWQQKMVTGMLYGSLLSSFIIVFIMMAVLFRSLLYGILAMIPLSVTILFIYGLIGLIGKDYDMPVAVLSSLTLGLSVDFAIHFLERAREFQKKFGGWAEAVKEMFKEPAMAISRNAITIAVGFTPLLFAPLVPYKTVGVFLAVIMIVSWIATLFILAALVTGLKRWLFKRSDEAGNLKLKTCLSAEASAKAENSKLEGDE
ncbi:MAG: MMPL family transporter, partial [Kiritimatiellales bacterium]